MYYKIILSKNKTPNVFRKIFFLKQIKGAITMKKLKLNKQSKPDFEELSRMISDLRDFLDETPDFTDSEWIENLDKIIDFQDEDGSFKLFDSYNIPSDARVDFCYIPTYICTAVLMKAYLLVPDAFTVKAKSALAKGLKMSCVKNLRGHGYDAFKGQIEALNLFLKAGLNEFLDLYPEICPEFTEMIGNIISQFRDRQGSEKFTGSWGESYESEIREINECFSTRKVFVYGTLMKGEANHGYLEKSIYLGKATIKGYEMYDVGWYPAIVLADNLIIGELYKVPLSDMPSIGMLEGEGSLYAKRCEKVRDSEGNETLAYVYVYLDDVSNLKKIPAWKAEYVWYVSYGSNMLKDRFLCYIRGGSYEGSRYHPPCDDPTPPVAVKAVDIPFGMYFGNISDSWHGSGVSFLDVTEPGKALGVAYLITKEQFAHVCSRENNGREPQPGCGWYEDIIDLGEMDGFEVKTITNRDLCDYNAPYQDYLETLKDGIKENWPEMSDDEIADYLESCIR